MPRSRALANSRSAICRPVAWSRLPVGSSAIRIAGFGRQRAGDRHALLLAARQLAGIVGQPVAEARPLRARARRARTASACAGKLQRHGDILQRRHVGDEVERLEDDADVAARESARSGPRSCRSRSSPAMRDRARYRRAPARRCTISSVDLPEPDGPTMPVASPRATSSVTPFRIWTRAAPRPRLRSTS